MGNVSQNISINSLASEAVFSQTGKVQKRIPNFETTVVDTSSQVLVFPPDIESSESDIDIPGVLKNVSELSADSDTVFRKPVRFSGAIVTFIIVMTFSWSVYSLFFTVKQDGTGDFAAIPIHTNESKILETSRISQLQLISEKLLSRSTWSDDEVNTFLDNWNNLSEDDLDKVIKQSWYQLLEFNVKKQITERKINEIKQVASKSDQSLLTLSLVMGISDRSNPDIALKAEKSQYDKLLNELTSELKHADEISLVATSGQESELTLNQKLRKKYALVTPEVHETKPDAVSTSHNNIKKNKVPVSQASTDQISETEIAAKVTDYRDAYISGNLKLMAKLFGTAEGNSNEYKKVKSNFEYTFNNTLNRSLNIYDIQINTSGNNAIVESKFNASVEFKNGKGTQYTVAKMKMLISKKNNNIIISQVNILDRKVNVVSSDRQQLSASNGMLSALNNDISLPTAAELQDVTTQLVASYETGNLKNFISLFSPDIKTNDRIDLEGVKQDYAQLFSTTSDRQMFIQNLKWTNETIGAKGTGDLEVTILSDEGKTVYSMEGKIQIVAQKIGHQVKITHLYHIEREK